MGAQFPEVTSVTVTGHYRLHVGFSDGREGDVDVSDLREADGVFEPLRSPDFFAQAFVDSRAGTVSWPNGADLAPEVLHEQVTGHHGRSTGVIRALGLLAAAIGVGVGARAATRGMGKSLRPEGRG